MGRVVTAVFFPIYVLSFWSYHLLPENHRTLTLIALASLQGLAWIGLYRSRSRLSPAALTAGIILSFLAARTSVPLFENDFYRYFWDGLHAGHGINPYQFAPAEAPMGRWQEIREAIDYPNLVTIYPPLAQVLFGVLARLSFGKLETFLWLLTTGGFLAFLLAFRVILRKERHPERSSLPLLFGLHPLIIKEWAQSCHYDSWVTAALLMGLGAGTALGSGFWIAQSTNLKMVTQLGLLASSPRAAAWWLVFALPPWLLFAPHLDRLAETFLLFGAVWEMNSGLFRWILEFLYATGVEPETAGLLTRAVCAGLWIAAVTWIYRRRPELPALEKLFWAIFLFVLTCAVPNSWYFTWCFPLLAFVGDERRRLWLLLGMSTLPFSYAYFHESQTLRTLLWDAEHAALWTCVILARPRKITENQAVCETPSTST